MHNYKNRKNTREKEKELYGPIRGGMRGWMQDSVIEVFFLFFGFPLPFSAIYTHRDVY